MVGAPLADALVQQGDQVDAISRSGTTENPGVRAVALDVHEKDCPAELLEGPGNAFILTGQTFAGIDYAKETATFRRLVEQLKMSSRRVFFGSTALVYGNSDTPSTEDGPCRPIEEYAKFKLDAEEIIKGEIPSERLVIMRFANVYGSPKNKGFIGFVLNQLREDKDALIKLNHQGLHTRDYIFVDDLVQAILAIKAQPDKNGTVNIATGHSRTLVDVMTALEKALGHGIKSEPIADGPEEAAMVTVSNRRLRDDFGFNHFTDFVEALRQTVKRYGK